MSNAAREAEAATQSAAKAIQQNAWVGETREKENHDKGLQNWDNFVKTVPHLIDKDLTWNPRVQDDKEHHEADHSEFGNKYTHGDEAGKHHEEFNKHYFDHGEHGTGKQFTEFSKLLISRSRYSRMDQVKFLEDNP